MATTGAKVVPQRPLSADITSVVSSRVRLATKLPLDNHLGQWSSYGAGPGTGPKSL